MFSRALIRLASLATLAAGLGAASLQAQDSAALVDALVRKGILTDQEAEEIRADLTRDFAITSSAGKLDIASNVTRLRIAGDARVRYQYDNEVTNGTSNNQDRSRYRYRIRLGLTADLGPNWSTGVRFESANGATSTNADLGSGTDNFSKATDFAYVGQVFLNYKNSKLSFADAVDARFGKFAHKFFNPGVNGFWIDSDINFEGAAQEITYLEPVGANSSLNFRAGQFILNANSTAGAKANDPSLLFIAQAELAKIAPSTGKGWRVAPAFVAFAAPSAHDAGTGSTINQPNDSAVYTDLATVLVPAEFITTVNDKPLAFYATYGFNFQGDDRSNRLYGAQNPSSYDQMFNVGVRYGATRLAGDYQLTAEYRYVESGAYTSLLLDSDFNGGRLGGEGPIASFSYNLTDSVAFTTTYFLSQNIDPNQPAHSGTNGLGYGKAQVIQVDLSARF